MRLGYRLHIAIKFGLCDPESWILDAFQLAAFVIGGFSLHIFSPKITQHVINCFAVNENEN